MKLIRNDNELKTYQRRNQLRDIVGNYSKTLLLYGTQNETKNAYSISGNVYKRHRKDKWSNLVTKIKAKRKSIK